MNQARPNEIKEMLEIRRRRLNELSREPPSQENITEAQNIEAEIEKLQARLYNLQNKEINSSRALGSIIGAVIWLLVVFYMIDILDEYGCFLLLTLFPVVVLIGGEMGKMIGR